MRVSIIIPVYNGADTLAEAIESAVNQTYLNREIIIVDDGSTDGSVSVALRYTDGMPIRIIRQTNQGLPTARNTGIAAALGEYILPLDADDKIAPDYLEKTVPLMTSVPTPSVGIVSTDMQYFGIDNKRIRPSHTTLEEAMKFNGMPVCSLIRKKALEQVGGYNPLMNEGCEDWELWIHLLKFGWRVAVLNEPLFFYRRKPVSMVSTMNQQKMIQVMRSCLHMELPW